MIEVVKAAITGNYKMVGDPKRADCTLAQSFGVGENGPGHVNELLARFVLEHAVDGPMLLQQEVAEALKAFPEAPQPALVIVGKPSTSVGGELDSWTVLKQAKVYMEERRLKHPLLVGQAHHIGRLTMQAIRQGMDPIVLEGLPKDFDETSMQVWTKYKWIWAIREVPGLLYLRAIGKL